MPMRKNSLVTDTLLAVPVWAQRWTGPAVHGDAGSAAVALYIGYRSHYKKVTGKAGMYTARMETMKMILQTTVVIVCERREGKS